MKAERNLAHKLEMTWDDLAFNVNKRLYVYVCVYASQLSSYYLGLHGMPSQISFSFEPFFSLSLSPAPFLPWLRSSYSANALKYVTHTLVPHRTLFFFFFLLFTLFLMNMSIHPSNHFHMETKK